DAWEAVRLRLASGRGPVQWAGVYHPAYRLSPHLDPAIAGGDASVDVVVELVASPRGDAGAERLPDGALAAIADDVLLRGLRDEPGRVPAARLAEIAALPDVTWIEPCLAKRKLDERQGQILAANLDAAGAHPAAPGYLAWLGAHGFASTFPFV